MGYGRSFCQIMQMVPQLFHMVRGEGIVLHGLIYQPFFKVGYHHDTGVSQVTIGLGVFPSVTFFL